MGVFIRKKRGFLYLDYKVGGRRYWEALHLKYTSDAKHNREIDRLAEIVRAKKEIQIASGEHGLIDPVESKRMLVAFAEQMAKTQGQKNALPKSLPYLRRYAGSIQLGAVNEKWVESYQQFLLSQEPLGKATARKYMDALRMVLRKATRDLIIPRNPAEAVRGISVPEHVKVILTLEEADDLARTPVGGILGAEVKRAFLFACMTGLRISDLRTLLWDNIQLGEDPQIVKQMEKTKKVIQVPLTQAALDMIIGYSECKPVTNPVFTRLSSTKTNTSQYLVTWAKKAGVMKQIGWHTARHSFATWALSAGVDLATVSRLLGHAKVTQTMVYAKSTDSTKRKAVETLPKLTLPIEGRRV